MKKVACVVMAIIAFSFFTGCATMKTADNHMLSNNVTQSPDIFVSPAVFIVGGYKSETGYLGDIKAAFPGSKIITPRKYVPISSAAVVLLEKIKAEGWKENQEVVFIAYSWSGLLCRQLVKDNPGMRARIIMIGTPSRSFWFLPEFLFRIENERPDVPVFVIAGNGYKGEVPWFLRDEPSDGVVETSSVLAVNAWASRVFPLKHHDLLHAEETINQMKIWATMPLPQTVLSFRRVE